MSTTVDRTGDSTKLLSLLALATGAAAMPQSVSADVIYTDLTSSPVTVGGSGLSSYTLSGLPGGVLGFQVQHRTSGGTYYRSVVVKKLGGAVSASVQGTQGFAVHRPLGAAWNAGYHPYATALVAKAVRPATGPSTHNPDSYPTHEYLSFLFKDASLGNIQLYGWIEVSMSNENSSDPNVTIYGYAYDTTGAQLATGIIPEPSSAALLALGALTLGAKGLRSWRRKRGAAD